MPDICLFSSTQIVEVLATLHQSSSQKIDNAFLMLRFWRDCINKEMKLSKIMSCHIPYLQHHRQHVFRAEMR